MKKLLLISAISLPLFSSAQILYGVYIVDSTVISFADSNTYPSNIVADTSAQPLWQIGSTLKSFFSSGTNSVKAIMTDTLNPYPVNANNWFTVKINQPVTNQIVTFWHRYQTDTGHHAGGIVEFSLDSGLTWQNVKGDCNVDSSGFSSGVRTENFYAKNDTLLTGQAAFNDTSNGSICSRVQFFSGYALKSTGSGCSLSFWEPIYLRFRFVSDSVNDTLAGWMIDSISLRQDYYEGYVAQVNKIGALNTYPNPSYEGLFNFPALNNENGFYIEVYNSIGDRILKTPYMHTIDLRLYPNGLYYYKATNGTEYYSGKLIKD